VSGAVPRPGDLLRARSGKEYRLSAWHAEGSFARVFRGETTHAPLTRCAVKVAKAEVPGAGAKLGREIETRRRFRHPHVPELLDEGCAGTSLFLALAWVDGATLRAVVERQRRLPLVTALTLLRDVAAVTTEMHAAGMAHGDLRADNVLVGPGQRGTQAIVTDLGEAVRRGEPGFDLALREDARRIGSLLYLMLTGVLPEQDAGRLSSAHGHHPAAVRLWESAAHGTPTTRELLRDVEALYRTIVRA
jgi:serine/threonine protein kinase